MTDQSGTPVLISPRLMIALSFAGAMRQHVHTHDGPVFIDKSVHGAPLTGLVHAHQLAWPAELHPAQLRPVNWDVTTPTLRLAWRDATANRISRAPVFAAASGRRVAQPTAHLPQGRRAAIFEVPRVRRAEGGAPIARPEAQPALPDLPPAVAAAHAYPATPLPGAAATAPAANDVTRASRIAARSFSRADKHESAQQSARLPLRAGLPMRLAALIRVAPPPISTPQQRVALPKMRGEMEFARPARHAPAMREVRPVDIQYRGKAPAARAAEPRQLPTPPPQQPQIPQFDLDRLTGEMWQRFEKRIRIERLRRGLV